MTGRFEVYVQLLSGEEGKVAISTDGGRWPSWSSQSDEIFYRRGTEMIVVPIELESSVRHGTPEIPFDWPYAQSFDVFPDGEHFVMVTNRQVDLREITVVVNWSTELTQIPPVP